MLFSEASGRKVVATTTAEIVGKLDDYVIDPSGPLVAAVKVKKADGDMLRWADITAFGTDAVTVESAEKITKGVGDDLAPLLDKRNQLHKKLVLTTTGDELGSVRDIDFDPASGHVITLVLDKGEIDATRLVGVGSYAVVVEAEAETATGANDPPASQASAPASATPPPVVPAIATPPVEPAAAAAPPPAASSTSLELTPSEPALVLEPPDLSQAQRATYPPGE